MNEKKSVATNQPKLYSLFKRILIQEKLAHAYLFEGPKNSGKADFALWLAQAIFCQNPIDHLPCGKCNHCTRITNHELPDVIEIIPDGQSIKIDQIRLIKSEFVRSGIEGTKKFLLIHQAEKMTINAANSLLKFLEEPDGQMTVCLLTENSAQILPTIKSRCQFVYFAPLTKEAIVEKLVEQQIPEKQSEFLAQLTGSVAVAVAYSKDPWFQEAKSTTQTWFDYLKQKDLQGFPYVQKRMVKVFKERSQQYLSLDMLSLFYHQELVTEVQIEETTKNQTESFVESLELILAARQKLVANVSFQNVCEQLAWRIIKGK